MSLYQLHDMTPQLTHPESNWIAPGSHVIGRVRLGVDVSIWFGAVLRGDNEWIDIGAGSNVQDGSVLHTDVGFPLTIGDGVTVGHRAILHGCMIGANTLIGMGATILNGARIGENSVVGANALVTEGKTFPDNSLIVGTPAKAIREIDSAFIEQVKGSAAWYVSKGREYMNSLKCVDP